MASKVMNYGRFHQKHGTSIRILEDGRVAHRMISYDKAVVYSEQPISIGNMFQVKILEYEESWSGSLQIGFTTQDPDNGGVPADALQCCGSPKYWILSAATVYHHGRERKVNLNIEELNVGDSVGCRVTKDGSLEFFANGVSKVVSWKKMPTAVPLWGFADVYGRTVKIKSEFCFEPTMQSMWEELTTIKRQLARYEDALQAKDQQNEELQQAILHLREERVQQENEFTSRLSAIEAQMRGLLPPWAIPETELEVTETILGRGAYGEVRVGVYHGDRVAVKRLHNVIASDYYHKMIQREMGIAARLRHPKLVLFIGAVTRGNLTIVTELMETSLRSELEHGRLKENHILPISRDVACALCYLHSLPEPIIHRDVSSANVLLNSTKGGWVAKLGDYGSANFQAKLQTVGPGCPVYAAPEASRPEEQGPKMDVYSYGVLVLEMCTGTLPDPRDLPVIQQELHSWGQPKRQLGELASRCINQSSDKRPHMRNVVTQLDGM